MSEVMRLFPLDFNIHHVTRSAHHPRVQRYLRALTQDNEIYDSCING